MNLKKLPENFWVIIITLVFTSIFVFTNTFDWDFFLTTIETDLRSLVVDFKLPSWSYQFCSGSTRAGDPQSYRLSPLIIFPVLFGSFWGAKVLLGVGTLVGAWYLKKIIKLINPELSELFVNLLIVGFLFNNFFMFHFFNGHLTFSSLFYAFPLMFYLLKVINNHRLGLADHTLNTVFLFLLLSGPFYQASIYFILPLTIATILYLIWDYRVLSRKDLWLLTASSALPLLFAFYRIKPVIDYQKNFPRTLNVTEWNNLHHIFFYFLAPISGRNFLWPLPQNAEFGVSENSFFGVIPLILLILVLLRPKKFYHHLKELSPLVKLSLSMMVVGVLFSLGNYYSFMPFSVLNGLFSNSIRVIGRFNFVTYLGLSFILISFLKGEILRDGFRKGILTIMIIIPLVSIFQHYTLVDLKMSLNTTRNFLAIDPIYPDKMQTLHVGRSRDYKSSYMYIPTLLGFSVPSCYQPMRKKTYLMHERFMDQEDNLDVHFMFGEEQSSSCLENSYFTQSELFIDPTCKKGSRVHLNFIEDKYLEKFNIITTQDGYILE